MMARLSLAGESLEFDGLIVLRHLIFSALTPSSRRPRTHSGLDAIGRVWDCRTGKSALVLAGHAKEILSVDFSPNGYQLATASGDDTVKIWDMRALKDIYTIPAHRSSVADVRFFRAGAERRAMAQAALQAADGAGLLANGHAAKSEGDDGMDVDVSGDRPANGGTGVQKEEEENAATEPAMSISGLYLATAGYDGLLKVWSADDWQLMRSLSGDAGKVMSVDISSGASAAMTRI